MSFASCCIRPDSSLIWIAILLLASPQRIESQPNLSIDVAAFGAAVEPNPGNPDQDVFIFFVGQPAILEVTITNLGEESQTVFSGGGGGGPFTFDEVQVSPEEAGECMISQSKTSVDCPSLTIPGMGSGKNAGSHHVVRFLIHLSIQEPGTGGYSFFVGNNATGESRSTGGQAEYRDVTDTRTLTVESIPTFVDIAVTPPGDTGHTLFSREYPQGVAVRLSAPDEIVTAITPLRFFSWSVDSGGMSKDGSVTVVMDDDRRAVAEYGTESLFGRLPIMGQSNRALSADVNRKTAAETADPIDVYADGILIVDDLGEDQVAPFRTVPLEAVIDITDGGAPDNSNPIRSFPYESDGAPAIIILTEDSQFVNQNARTEADDSTQTDVTLFVPLPSEITDGIRVVHRTPSTETELLGADNPLDENGFTAYASLLPGPGVVEILDRASGTQLEAFQGELADGTAILGVLRENATGKRQGFTLLLFDAEGNNVETAVVTSTSDDETAPSAFVLHGNYPNPFNSETVIRFEVAARAHVRLQVLNALGQIVGTLVDGLHDPGTYSAKFDARALPSSAYFYRMTAGEFSETRPMVLMR